ncbi:MAG TPA: alpha/beta hydrolase [Chloroflexota bacterium]
MSTTISSDGTVIAFDRVGSGPPVILVHPAFSHRSFNPEMAELARLLSTQLTVFNYDRRGRGESGDGQPYAVEREIEDLAALIRAAGGSAFVYGMSSGAVLALEAANHGLAIEKLALYEPPFITDDTRPPVPDDFLPQMRDLISADRGGDAVEYFMTTGPGVPAEVVAQMRTQPVWPAFEAVAHTLVYDVAVMGDTQQGKPLAPERLDGVAVPTLVIVGSESPAWARNSTQALTNGLRDGQLRVLEGGFHAIPPATLALVLLEFFGAVGPSEAATGAAGRQEGSR